MKKSKKIISFLTALLFACNEFTPLQAWDPAPAMEVKISAPAFQFSLPPDLGKVQEIHSDKGPALVHIQTAHGNYQAQKKIQAILHHLKKEYGIKTVFLEGSAFKLEPDLLRFFPNDKPRTMKAANGLAKKALVKGPELFLLEEPDAKGYGIEDLSSYVANGKAFHEVLAQKEKALFFLEAMRLEIEKQSNLTLNRDLKDFLKKLDGFETKKTVDLPAWLAYLREQGKTVLETDLLEARHQIDWPMLVRLYKLKEIESKINLQSYEKEKGLFLKIIRNVPQEIFRQVEKLLSSPLSENQLPDPETALLFEKLISALPPLFNFVATPNVKYFIAHLILQSELKSDLLFEEVDALTEKISLKLAPGEKEKQVLELLKDYRLLQRLFALELTARDHELLLKREDSLRSRVEEFKQVHINALFEKCLDFYRLAKDRDDAMIRNIEKRFAETGQNKAAVITGGFHSGPFKKYFETKGYNYALVAPKITSASGPENYQKAALLKGLDFSSSTWEDPYLMDPHLLLPKALALELQKINPKASLRSELRSGDPEFTDEVSAVLALGILKKFEERDEFSHRWLIPQISYLGQPQMLWAKSMVKPMLIHSAKVNAEKKDKWASAILIDEALRIKIEAAHSGTHKEAVEDLLFLWLIRETALDRRMDGEMKEKQAYYELAPKRKTALRKLVEELDAGSPGKIFELQLQKLEQFQIQKDREVEDATIQDWRRQMIHAIVADINLDRFRKLLPFLLDDQGQLKTALIKKIAEPLGVKPANLKAGDFVLAVDPFTPVIKDFGWVITAPRETGWRITQDTPGSRILPDTLLIFRLATGEELEKIRWRGVRSELRSGVMADKEIRDDLLQGALGKLKVWNSQSYDEFIGRITYHGVPQLLWAQRMSQPAAVQGMEIKTGDGKKTQLSAFIMDDKLREKLEKAFEAGQKSAVENLLFLLLARESGLLKSHGGNETLSLDFKPEDVSLSEARAYMQVTHDAVKKIALDELIRELEEGQDPKPLSLWIKALGEYQWPQTGAMAPLMPELFKGMGTLEDIAGIFIDHSILYVIKQAPQGMSIRLVLRYDLNKEKALTPIGIPNLKSLGQVVTDGGLLYLADPSGNRVVIYHLGTGIEMPSFTSATFGLKSEFTPHGLAVIGNTMYITNSSSDAVLRYDLLNKRSMSPLKQGDFNGNLSGPELLAVHGSTLLISNKKDSASYILRYDTQSGRPLPGPLTGENFGKGLVINQIRNMTVHDSVLYAVQTNKVLRHHLLFENPLSPLFETSLASHQVRGFAIQNDTIHIAEEEFLQPWDSHAPVFRSRISRFPVMGASTPARSEMRGKITAVDPFSEPIVARAKELLQITSESKWKLKQRSELRSQIKIDSEIPEPLTIAALELLKKWHVKTYDALLKKISYDDRPQFLWAFGMETDAQMYPQEVQIGNEKKILVAFIVNAALKENLTAQKLFELIKNESTGFAAPVTRRPSGFKAAFERLPASSQDKSASWMKGKEINNDDYLINVWFGAEPVTGAAYEDWPRGWFIDVFVNGGAKYQILFRGVNGELKLMTQSGMRRITSKKDPFYDLIYDEKTKSLTFVFTDKAFQSLNMLEGKEEMVQKGSALTLRFFSESKWKSQARSELRSPDIELIEEIPEEIIGPALKKFQSERPGLYRLFIETISHNGTPQMLWANGLSKRSAIASKEITIGGKPQLLTGFFADAALRDQLNGKPDETLGFFLQEFIETASGLPGAQNQTSSNQLRRQILEALASGDFRRASALVNESGKAKKDITIKDLAIEGTIKKGDWVVYLHYRDGHPIEFSEVKGFGSDGVVGRIFVKDGSQSISRDHYDYYLFATAEDFKTMQPKDLPVPGIEAAFERFPSPIDASVHSIKKKHLSKKSYNISFERRETQDDNGWYLKIPWANDLERRHYEIYWSINPPNNTLRIDTWKQLSTYSTDDPFFDVIYDEKSDTLTIILTDSAFRSLRPPVFELFPTRNYKDGWEEKIPGTELKLIFTSEYKWKTRARSEMRGKISAVDPFSETIVARAKELLQKWNQPLAGSFTGTISYQGEPQMVWAKNPPLAAFVHSDQIPGVGMTSAFVMDEKFKTLIEEGSLAAVHFLYLCLVKETISLITRKSGETRTVDLKAELAGLRAQAKAYLAFEKAEKDKILELAARLDPRFALLINTFDGLDPGEIDSEKSLNNFLAYIYTDPEYAAKYKPEAIFTSLRTENAAVAKAFEPILRELINLTDAERKKQILDSAAISQLIRRTRGAENLGSAEFIGYVTAVLSKAKKMGLQIPLNWFDFFELLMESEELKDKFSISRTDALVRKAATEARAVLSPQPEKTVPVKPELTGPVRLVPRKMDEAFEFFSSAKPAREVKKSGHTITVTYVAGKYQTELELNYDPVTRLIKTVFIYQEKVMDMDDRKKEILHLPHPSWQISLLDLAMDANNKVWVVVPNEDFVKVPPGDRLPGRYLGLWLEISSRIDVERNYYNDVKDIFHFEPVAKPAEVLLPAPANAEKAEKMLEDWDLSSSSYPSIRRIFMPTFQELLKPISEARKKEILTPAFVNQLMDKARKSPDFEHPVVAGVINGFINRARRDISLLLPFTEFLEIFLESEVKDYLEQSGIGKIISSAIADARTTARSEMRSTEIEFMEEIPEAMIGPALKKLRAAAPELYRRFMEKITYNGTPQMLWAKGLSRNSDIVSHPVTIGRQTITLTGFFVDAMFRNSMTGATQDIRDNFFFLELMLTASALEPTPVKDEDDMTEIRNQALAALARDDFKQVYLTLVPLLQSEEFAQKNAHKLGKRITDPAQELKIGQAVLISSFDGSKILMGIVDGRDKFKTNAIKLEGRFDSVEFDKNNFFLVATPEEFEAIKKSAGPSKPFLDIQNLFKKFHEPWQDTFNGVKIIDPKFYLYYGTKGAWKFRVNDTDPITLEWYPNVSLYDKSANFQAEAGWGKQDFIYFDNPLVHLDWNSATRTLSLVLKDDAVNLLLSPALRNGLAGIRKGHRWQVLKESEWKARSEMRQAKIEFVDEIPESLTAAALNLLKIWNSKVHDAFLEKITYDGGPQILWASGMDQDARFHSSKLKVGKETKELTAFIVNKTLKDKLTANQLFELMKGALKAPVAEIAEARRKILQALANGKNEEANKILEPLVRDSRHHDLGIKMTDYSQKPGQVILVSGKKLTKIGVIDKLWHTEWSGHWYTFFSKKYIDISTGSMKDLSVDEVTFQGERNAVDLASSHVFLVATANEFEEFKKAGTAGPGPAGARSEMRSGKIEFIDEIPEAMIGPALKKLEVQQPELYRTLMRKISYAGMPQLLWVNGLSKPSAVDSKEIKIGGKPKILTGFLVDARLRKTLSGEAQKKWNDFFFRELLKAAKLIHEAQPKTGSAQTSGIEAAFNRLPSSFVSLDENIKQLSSRDHTIKVEKQNDSWLLTINSAGRRRSSIFWGREVAAKLLNINAGVKARFPHQQDPFVDLIYENDGKEVLTVVFKDSVFEELHAAKGWEEEDPNSKLILRFVRESDWKARSEMRSPQIELVEEIPESMIGRALEKMKGWDPSLYYELIDRITYNKTPQLLWAKGLNKSSAFDSREVTIGRRKEKLTGFFADVTLAELLKSIPEETAQNFFYLELVRETTVLLERRSDRTVAPDPESDPKGLAASIKAFHRLEKNERENLRKLLEELDRKYPGQTPSFLARIETGPATAAAAEAPKTAGPIDFADIRRRILETLAAGNLEEANQILMPLVNAKWDLQNLGTKVEPLTKNNLAPGQVVLVSDYASSYGKVGVIEEIWHWNKLSANYVEPPSNAPNTFRIDAVTFKGEYGWVPVSSHDVFTLATPEEFKVFKKSLEEESATVTRKAATIKRIRRAFDELPSRWKNHAGFMDVKKRTEDGEGWITVKEDGSWEITPYARERAPHIKWDEPSKTFEFGWFVSSKKVQKIVLPENPLISFEDKGPLWIYLQDSARKLMRSYGFDAFDSITRSRFGYYGWTIVSPSIAVPSYARSEMRASKISLLDEIDEVMIAPALRKVQADHPDLYRELINKITYNGTPQMLWATGLSKSSAIQPHSVKIGGKTETLAGFFVNIDLRDSLSGKTQEAVDNFFFHELVQAASDLIQKEKRAETTEATAGADSFATVRWKILEALANGDYQEAHNILMPFLKNEDYRNIGVEIKNPLSSQLKPGHVVFVTGPVNHMRVGAINKRYFESERSRQYMDIPSNDDGKRVTAVLFEDDVYLADINDGIFVIATPEEFEEIKKPIESTKQKFRLFKALPSHWMPWGNNKKRKKGDENALIQVQQNGSWTITPSAKSAARWCNLSWDARDKTFKVTWFFSKEQIYEMRLPEDPLVSFFAHEKGRLNIILKNNAVSSMKENGFHAWDGGEVSEFFNWTILPESEWVSGSRSEMRQAEIEFMEEIPETMIGPALKKFEAEDPELYKKFIRGISYDGAPQMFWAKGLQESSALLSRPFQIGDKTVKLTGFVADAALRDSLSSKPQSAIDDFFFRELKRAASTLNLHITKQFFNDLPFPRWKVTYENTKETQNDPKLLFEIMFDGRWFINVKPYHKVFTLSWIQHAKELWVKFRGDATIKIPLPENPLVALKDDEKSGTLNIILNDQAFHELSRKFDILDSEKKYGWAAWRIWSETNWTAEQSRRSEMRAKAKIESHSAIPSVLAYYESRNNLAKAITTGDAGLYEKSLAECVAHSDAAMKKIGDDRPEEKLRAIIAHIRERADLPFAPKTIGDDLEMTRIHEESFNADERETIETQVTAFIGALGYEPEMRDDIVRKIKLIVYPLTLLNMMPKSIRGHAYNPEALRFLLSQLELFVTVEAKTIGGATLLDPFNEKDLTIQILRKIKPISFKPTLFHEIIHYLALENYLPFNMASELITEAVTVLTYLQANAMDDMLDEIPIELTDHRKAYGTMAKRGEEAALKKQRLMTPGEIESMVRDFMAAETPALLALPPQVLNDLTERISGFYLGGYAWGLHQNDSKVDPLKFVVDYGKKNLPRVRSANFSRKLTHRDWALINEILPTLRAITRVTIKDADERVHLVPRALRDLKSLDRTRWFYERDEQAMHYIPWDIIEYGAEASAGLTLQEAFRTNYSEEGLIEPAYDTAPFRLLYGVAESSRVVAQGLAENPGRVAEIETFYRKKLRIFDPEIEKERMAERPLFVQYIEGLFYTLALTQDPENPAEDPRITNAKVKAAIEKTFPEILNALGLSGENFYQVLRDRVWPEVKKLFDEDKEEKMKDELENDALNQLIEDGDFEVTDEEPPPGEAKAPAKGQKLKISVSPGPSGKVNPMDLSEKAKQKLKEKVDEMLRDMKKAEREERERKAAEELDKEIGEEQEEMSDVTSSAPSMPSRKKSGGGKSGKPGGKSPGSGGDEKELKQDLEELQQMTKDIQEQAGEIEQGAAAASEAAEGADKQAGAIDRAAGGATGAGENIAEGLKKLIEKIKALREKAKQFGDKAESMEDKVDDFEDQAGERKSPALDKMRKRAGEIKDLAGEMEEDAAASDKAANEAAASGEELKDKLAEKKQVEGIKGRAKAIQEKMDEVMKKLARIREEADEAGKEAGGMAENAEEFEEEEKALPDIAEDGPQSKKKGAGGSGAHVRIKKKAKPGETEEDQQEDDSEAAPAAKQAVHRFDPAVAEKLRKFLEDEKEEAAPDTAGQAAAILAHTGLTPEQRTALEAIRNPARALEATLRENILSALENVKRSEIARRQRKGRLSSRTLPLVTTGAKDLFELKKEPGEKKLRQILVLDLSGSMFQDRYNFRLGDIDKNMLEAKNRINNLIKVVILYLQAFREDNEVEQAIIGFADRQKVLLDFGQPVTDEGIYKLIESILKQTLGGSNTDYAALKMAVELHRKQDREKGAQPKIITIIADGGINYGDGEQIKKILEENKDIAFIARGIGPQSIDVVNAYAPYGKAVPDVANLVNAIREDLQVQSSRLLQEEARSELRVVVPASITVKKIESEHFMTLTEGADTFLVLKDGSDPDFKIKINGEGANIPDVELPETKTNIDDIINILKSSDNQQFDRSPFLFIGEAGTGKNIKIYYAARLRRKHVRFMAMHDDIVPDDLTERRGVNEKEQGKTNWTPAPLVEAMKHGDWLILDEVNKAKPEVLARLNDIIQSRQVDLHDGTSVKAHPDFAIFMTANPPPGPNDAKVYQVAKNSAEMLDRLFGVKTGYLPAKEEMELLYAKLMKKRGYTKPEEIPEKERTLVKNLVDTANDMRERYFGRDSSTSHSIGRGKIVARPLTTRALVNIIDRIADFPDEAQRMRSVIRRFYSYDWERDEQKRNAEQIINKKFVEDKLFVFSGDDLKGPRYGKNKARKRVLEFAGIEVELGPKAPKDLDEVPLDMRLTWTKANLHHLRDMMMDFKQGNHMLFIGEAGTGKDTIAKYVSYLIHGPVVETFGITSSAMVEDLIAFLGIGEGEKVGTRGTIVNVEKHETGLVPGYVVRAMREGRPVILDEVNKGKAEVLAVLNNILQFGWIDLANGVREYAKPGFSIIATMNPSSQSVYIGNNHLSGEFIDRFSAYKMDYLEEDDEIEILMDFNRYLKEVGPDFKILKKEFIKLLVKFVRELRKKNKDGKLPRPISMRGSKRVIVRLAKYPGEYKTRLEKLIHECIFFHDQAHVDEVTNAMKEVKLAGLPAIAEVAIETGDAQIDRALEALKKSVPARNDVISKLAELDAVLRAKKSDKHFGKTRQIFSHIADSELIALKNKVISSLVIHLRDRLDGNKRPALPLLIMEIPMTREWDLENSKELGVKTVGKKINGIVLSLDSDLPQILEIGNEKFLWVREGDWSKSADAVQSIGLKLYGEEHTRDAKGGELFEEYYKKLQEMKSEIKGGADKDTVIKRAGFKKFGHDFMSSLGNLAKPKLSPFLFEGNQKAFFEAFDKLGLSIREQKALLTALNVLWEDYSDRVDFRAEISRRLAELSKRSEMRTGGIMPKEEISAAITAAALEMLKEWNEIAYLKFIQTITLNGELQLFWAEGMTANAQFYSIDIGSGTKKQPITALVVNIALNKDFTAKKLFELIKSTLTRFDKPEVKMEIITLIHGLQSLLAELAHQQYIRRTPFQPPVDRRDAANSFFAGASDEYLAEFDLATREYEITQDRAERSIGDLKGIIEERSDALKRALTKAGIPPAEQREFLLKLAGQGILDAVFAKSRSELRTGGIIPKEEISATITAGALEMLKEWNQAAYSDFIKKITLDGELQLFWAEGMTTDAQFHSMKIKKTQTITAFAVNIALQKGFTAKKLFELIKNNLQGEKPGKKTSAASAPHESVRMQLLKAMILKDYDRMDEIAASVQSLPDAELREFEELPLVPVKAGDAVLFQRGKGKLKAMWVKDANTMTWGSMHRLYDSLPTMTLSDRAEGGKEIKLTRGQDNFQFFPLATAEELETLRREMEASRSELRAADHESATGLGLVGPRPKSELRFLTPELKSAFENLRAQTLPFYLFSKLSTQELVSLLENLLHQPVYSEKAGRPAAVSYMAQTLGEGPLVTSPQFSGWVRNTASENGRVLLSSRLLTKLAAKSPRALYILLSALQKFSNSRNIHGPLIAVSGNKKSIFKKIHQALLNKNNGLNWQEKIEVQNLLLPRLAEIVAIVPSKRAAQYVREQNYGVATLLPAGESSLSQLPLGAQFFLAGDISDLDLGVFVFLIPSLLKAAALVRGIKDPLEQTRVLNHSMEQILPGATPAAQGFAIHLAKYIQEIIINERLAEVSA